LNVNPSILANVSNNNNFIYDDAHKQLFVVADNKLLFWDLPEISNLATDFKGKGGTKEDQGGFKSPIQGLVKGAKEGGSSASANANDTSSPSVSALSPRPASPQGSSTPTPADLFAVSPKICFLSQGPVITARFSPDQAILAVQRSVTEIEFVNQRDGSQFWQKCKGTSMLGLAGSESTILGFFWCSDMSKYDIVFVTTGGLELYKLLDSQKGLQLKEVKKHSIKWYKYTSDTKLVIIATGEDCSRLFGYQFAPQGLIKLPRFDIDIGESTNNSGDSSQQQKSGMGGAKHPHTLSPDSIHPVAIYGKLFCCHVNSVAERVVLYRLYKDAIIKQFSYPTYSKDMGISVVDNLLLVHHMSNGLVMIFDIMTKNMQPFVSPLPVLVFCKDQLNMNHSKVQSCNDGEDYDSDDVNPFKGKNQVVCFTMSRFLLAMDVGKEMIWKIEIDLNAIAMSCPNRLHTISFLHRRSRNRINNARMNPTALIISTVKTMLQEHEKLSILKQAFEIICFVISSNSSTGGSSSSSNNAQTAGQSPSQVQQVSNNDGERLELEQIYHQIFESLFEDQEVEPDFLFHAMETFYLCSLSFSLQLPSCFFCLMVEMLLLMGKFDDLTTYLSGRFFEDSTDLAAKLESLSEEYEHMSHYAIDMYFRLKKYEACCSVLFKHNRIIDALRILKEYHLSSISPVTFLEAAKNADPMTRASVFRFCSEFVPGFKDMNISF
jgi:hypothetical protein